MEGPTPVMALHMLVFLQFRCLILMPRGKDMSPIDDDKLEAHTTRRRLEHPAREGLCCRDWHRVLPVAPCKTFLFKHARDSETRLLRQDQEN